MAKRISVRPATVSDARGIADVHVAAWRGAYEAIVPAEVLARQSVGQRQNWWEKVLAPDAGRGLGVDVALVDDVIAGFCAVGLSRDDEAALEVGELHALYVHPSQWGRGTGSALLSHGEQRLSSDFRLAQAALWVLEEPPAASGPGELVDSRAEPRACGRYRLGSAKTEARHPRPPATNVSHSA